MTLSELFGESILVMVLDFFLENRFWDYSKTDVAKHIGKSRQSMNKVWPTLERFNIIIPSRKIGGTTLYKINPKSETVKKLSELSLVITVLS